MINDEGGHRKFQPRLVKHLHVPNVLKPLGFFDRGLKGFARWSTDADAIVTL
jgi:hypothetical protein